MMKPLATTALFLVLASCGSARPAVPPPAEAERREQPTVARVGQSGRPTSQETQTARSDEAPGPTLFRAGAIGSEAQALEAFERAWTEALVPRLTQDRPEVVRRWQGNMSSSSHSRSAVREACAEGAARVRGTLGPDEQQRILYGTVADLESGGDCWLVTVSAGFDTLMTYFTAREGLLLLAWSPPEG